MKVVITSSHEDFDKHMKKVAEIIKERNKKLEVKKEKDGVWTIDTGISVKNPLLLKIVNNLIKGNVKKIKEEFKKEGINVEVKVV